jgi:3-hydroxyacyl-CoA dehydrogenase / enoyl-CoA hydratase / 3-hydroxybutyryl-CoA epimerase
VKETRKHIAPWDVKGYKVKDGPFTPGGAMTAVGGNAMVSKQTNLNYPGAAQYPLVHL